MRILKRSLAMLLAVLMLVSMATVGVSASSVVYVVNDSDWATVNAYVWDNGVDNSHEATWPGTTLSLVEGTTNVYSYTVTNDSSDTIILNNGSAQTADLPLSLDNYYTTSGVRYSNTYYVRGDARLTGSDWKATEDNKMSMAFGTGIAFTKTFTGITAPAESYGFKVDKGDWRETYPDKNWNITREMFTGAKNYTEDGLATVKITLSADKVISVDITYPAAPDGINTYAELKAAIDAGQTEITLTGDITVEATLEVDDTITINGDYTLTAGGKLDPMIKVVEGGNLTVNNVTFDGAKTAICAASTRTSDSKYASYLTMNDVTVKNFANDGWGAVYNFGSSVATLNNCTFADNTTENAADSDAYYAVSDVWSGAATTLNINGGSYSDVYMNADSGSSSTINVDGGATIKSLTLGYSTVSGKTAAYNVKNGTVTDLTDMVLDTTMTVQNDGNKFGSVINNRKTYGNIELLGAQTRNDTEGADDMRFIAVADTDLLEQADDYGFTFVNVGNMDVLEASQLAKTLNPAAKGISCKNSSNSVAGDYGKYDTDTEYKYVTGAITDIADSDKDIRILAMFYVTINGRTVLAPYNGYTAVTSGLAASFNDANKFKEVI